MNIYISIGSTVVILALLSYSLGSIPILKKRHITSRAMGFMTLGVLLDIAATTFMIIGSSNSPFTLHGIIGYTALGGMLTDAVMLSVFRNKNGADKQISKGLHFYSLIAFVWWVVAFVTGGMLVAVK